MKTEDIEAVAVLGAGIMGHGIAQSFLMGGYPVRLFDIAEPILDNAAAHIRENLDLFSRHGLLSESDVSPCLERLTTTCDLKAAVEGAQFITEAAPENLELKQSLFEDMEKACPQEAILASNTSSLTLAQIGVRVQNKQRLVTTHWFNPPHIVPTVEVVRSPWTSDETLDVTYNLLVRIKKTPVRIRQEIPGFLINRIQMAMVREILDLYEKGIASAEDIDRAVKGSIGFRLASIGPLLTMDLGGLKLWLRVCENLFPEIRSSTNPPEALVQLTEQGCDGIKTGKGFYDYTRDFSKSELDQAIRKRDEEFLHRLKNLYRI
ncbi:MAG: 3-hydroxyacyl-CoA dehydrogenase family protein [Candidatus Desulfacyla sp.]